MRLLRVLVLLIWHIKFGKPQTPPLEIEHDPNRFTTTIPRFFEGNVDRMPTPYETPDFREEEPSWFPYRAYYYREEQRPYRLSPAYKASSRWYSYEGESMSYAACYCTTVYKRLTPLAGCAVITTRHILTTATSTHLILRDRYDYPTLENILGAWYDANHNNYNNSMYFTPARIHYHPNWHYPEHVNRSHPFSFTFDLAVWAGTYNVFGWYLNGNSAYVCLRATSHSRDQAAPTPTNEIFVVVGFQFMWAYKKKPMPWFKYGVRTRQTTNPCPKIEWGWFICLYGDWAKYGIESGAALHRSFKGLTWRYDGLVAMSAFSMKLRSIELTHYFTILDCHEVLDWLMDAYDSRQKYAWLDERFYDSKNQAPVVRPGYYIPKRYDIGTQHDYYEPPLW